MKWNLKVVLCAILTMCMLCTPLFAYAEEEIESFFDMDDGAEVYEENVEQIVPEIEELILGEEDDKETTTVESEILDSDYATLTDQRFEDKKFREYVLDAIDKNPKNGIISKAEAAAVNKIDIHDRGITSLKGIEIFTNLRMLKCTGNNISELEIGQLKYLLNNVKYNCPNLDTETLTINYSDDDDNLVLMTDPETQILIDGKVFFDPINGLKLRYSKKTVGIGATFKLFGSNTHIPANYCTFESNKKSVATVDGNGKVTAKAAGKAVITVTGFDDTVAKCVVTVSKGVTPQKITISESTLNMGVGEEFTLTAEVEPTKAQTEITWSSSNEDVAYVENGVVTAVGKGNATIVVKTDNSLKSACKVKVTAAPKSIAFEASDVDISVGQEKILKITLSKNAQCNIALTCDDPEVINVEPAEEGCKVEALKEGVANITASTYNGFKAVCTVTVKSGPDKITVKPTNARISVGMTVKLVPTVTLEGQSINTKLTFTSDNTSICTVESDGLVKARKAGKATITVKAANGKYAECTVNVVKAPDGLDITKTAVTLEYSEKTGSGTSEKLDVKITKGSIAIVTFTSSNTDVAVVDDEGVVTATGVGTATITAKTHNNKKDTCKVTVKRKTIGSIAEIDDIIVVAHRGGKTGSNENTLSAFKTAPATGAEMVEMDVRSTKDGIQIIFHDKSFKVDKKTYTLKNYKYSVLKAKRANLCTLDEALEVIANNGMLLMLELKDTADAKKCVAAIKKYNLENRVIYVSFDHNKLEKVLKYAPNAKLGLAFENKVPSKLNKYIKELNPYCLMVQDKLLTQGRLDDWHSKGLKVDVWTVDDYDSCLRWMDMGVDYITSNYPERAVEARSEFYN